MKLVMIGKNYYSLPITWNELTAKKLRQVMTIFASDKIEIEHKRALLFKVIAGISTWKLYFLKIDDYDDLIYVADFLFFKNSLTKNLLLCYGGMYGPADNFDNLLISEFVFTEMLYIDYNDETLSSYEREQHLNKLLAVLYRDAKPNYNKKLNPDGDVRVRFNDNTVSHRSSRTASFPKSIKQSIVHWYEGCRLNLTEEFEEVFKGGNAADTSKYGLWDLIYNIADKGIFGNFAMVETQFLKTVLMALTKIMAEAAALKTAS